MTRTTFLCALALVFSSLGLAGNVPRAAGELTFKAMDGKQVNLADLKGKFVAVLFFSTDCPHCQATADKLAPIYSEFHAKGFEILGLAVNPSAAANLDEFAADHKVQFPLGLSTRQQWTAFCEMPLMGRHYVPHLVFVDKTGKIVEDHPGMDREFWLDQENLIRAAINKYL
ncbi:MAG: redoxin domain-containing protein [Acidobacteria bacterium]|nr:redoxin domain-containing protein [Acidobacteriota bacterium]